MVLWDSCGPQVFSKMSRNGVTVRIDNRFENFAAILLSWMLGDPHFSFRRSLPFLILSILTKKKKKKKKTVREKLQIFRLLCSRATEVFFLRLICIVFQGLFHLTKNISCKSCLVILVMLNWVRLSDLNFTNVASKSAPHDLENEHGDP